MGLEGEDMPIYEYKCSQGHRFEAVRPHAGSQKTHSCPQCGAEAQRLPSLFSYPRGRGIYLFDRRTGRDLLHDD